MRTLSRRAAVTTVVVLLGGLATILLAAALVGGDDGDDAAPATGPAASGDVTATTAGSSIDVVQGDDGVLLGDAPALINLLTGTEGTAYHATYAATAEGGPDSVLEVWRSGDQLRTDTRVSDAEQSIATTTVTGPDGTVSCRQEGGGDWSCQRVADGSGGLFADLEATLNGVPVTATGPEVIDGRDAECFSFTTDGGPGRVCASAAGVIVALASGGGTIELAMLDDVVGPDDFALPAPVT